MGVTATGTAVAVMTATEPPRQGPFDLPANAHANSCNASRAPKLQQSGPVQFLLFVTTAVAVVAAYILWVRIRRRHVDFPISTDITPNSIAGLTWSRVIEGNRVEIIQNSGFFTAFLDDVTRARHHVHLETFLWMDGEVSDAVVEGLTAKAREGVEVRVLVDHRGGITTSPATWLKLRRAGVDFRVYHRARFRELGWYNNRDHRKIVVIDGRIGYTFGHGIADMWTGDGWRDTAARIEGPVVNDLQSAFLDNWIKVTRRALTDEVYFPHIEPCGSTAMSVAYAAPPETISAVQRLYYLAIASAKHELILQNPYFIPDRHAVRLCAEAVARGVKVKLMLPTSKTSDFPIVQHASHYYYGPLLRAGATIHEYTESGIHQKVMIVDRRWCTIGSTNFDPRSFNINDEITVAIYDASVAEELAREFEADLPFTIEWTLERWLARTWWHRTRDRASAMVKRQL
jgi:cardiolipin synthase A/B